MALALSSRRRSAAAVLSVLAAVALAIAVVGRGCGVAEPGPEAAVRGLVAAAAAGDREAVYRWMSPSTQAVLDERAQRATELVGANVRYTAADLIALGPAEEVAAPTEVRVVERRGDRVTVEVVSSGGRARLEVVKIDGRWRIDLPSLGATP
jgi:hypothetical protein